MEYNLSKNLLSSRFNGLNEDFYLKFEDSGLRLEKCLFMVTPGESHSRFFTGHYAYLPYDGGDVEFSENFIEVFKTLDFSINLDSNLLEFILTCLMHKNKYLYEFMTRKLVDSRPLLGNAIVLIVENLNNLDSIEKVQKVLGAKTFVKMFGDEGFAFDNEKTKVSQILGVPMLVINKMAKMGADEIIPALQKLAEKDVNNAVLFADYIESIYYSVSNPARGNELHSVYQFVHRLIKVLELEPNLNLKNLLNYLLRQENLYYSKIKLSLLPLSTIIEYYDYLGFVKNIGLKTYELMPKDLILSYKILRENSKIIQAPRSEEFEASVNSYRNLEYSNKDFLVMVPSSELELFREGNTLQHCVANYRDKIIEGTIVLFLRLAKEPNVPYATIEYSKGCIIQSKTKFDQDCLSLEVCSFLNEWINQLEEKGIA